MRQLKKTNLAKIMPIMPKLWCDFMGGTVLIHKSFEKQQSTLLSLMVWNF